MIPNDVNKFPSFWFVNSAKSYESGEHWVSCFFPSPNSPAEFFCSLGNKPSEYSSKLMSILKHNGNGQVTYNLCAVQAADTLTCSYFCLYVIDMRCRGVAYSDCLNNFSCSDKEHNEQLVSKYVQIHMRN